MRTISAQNQSHWSVHTVCVHMCVSSGNGVVIGPEQRAGRLHWLGLPQLIPRLGYCTDLCLCFWLWHDIWGTVSNLTHVQEYMYTKHRYRINLPYILQNVRSLKGVIVKCTGCATRRHRYSTKPYKKIEKQVSNWNFLFNQYHSELVLWNLG